MPGLSLDRLTSVFSVNTVIWVAVVLSLLLLVLCRPLSEIFSSRRRDLTMRLLQAVVFLLVPGLALVPAVAAAADSGGILTYGLAIYVVLFSLFCYYLGKHVGTTQGKKHISELVGLDTADSVEDAQDRLFESRMRFPSRAAVVESIGRMAKEREVQRLEEERIAVGRAPTIAEVDAEEVVAEEYKKDKRP